MSDKPTRTEKPEQKDAKATRSGDLPSERRAQDPVQAFLNQVARTPPPRPDGGRGRLIFAMDATASREPTWDQACQVQGQMFLETAALGGLDVQLMYYRGFSECKASRWVDNPSDLVRLMTGVLCLAGQTKIKRILQHAIKETDKKRVAALVFVGDAFEENLDEIGQIAGQLGMLGVRAFMFQEGHKPEAERAFRHIATLTKGAHCRFDSGSPEQLRELLGAVAAYAAGGRRALSDLSKRSSKAVKLIASQVG
ncbi:MAG: VWA domain-containing protein [Geminicoccaceae bacterium]